MQMAKILLAEDDKTMVSLLKTLLKMEGFDVVALDADTDVAAAVQREKPHALFMDVQHSVFETWFSVSVALGLANNARGAEQEESQVGQRMRAISQLEELGRLLLGTVPPWTTSLAPRPDIDMWLRKFSNREGSFDPLGELTTGSLVGTCLVIAAAFEGMTIRTVPATVHRLKKKDKELFGGLTDVWFARLEKKKGNREDAVFRGIQRMVALGFGAKEQELLTAWMRHEVNFLSTPQKND